MIARAGRFWSASVQQDVHGPQLCSVDFKQLEERTVNAFTTQKMLNAKEIDSLFNLSNTQCMHISKVHMICH